MDEEAVRRAAVESQLRGRGITDPRVLDAMRAVPRHRFVPPELRRDAYEDRPLPIGHGQTISQPYVVAFAAQAIEPEPGDRVLDVGTGCGYQAAVLAELVSEVVSVEVVAPLAERARETLAALGYANARVHVADGYRGWPDGAPYDAIVGAAAAPRVPEPLLEQLADGGRLVMPIGGAGEQQLVRIRRRGDELAREDLLPVAYVPMTGEARRG